MPNNNADPNDNVELFRTNLSQAFWCTCDGHFQPAKMTVVGTPEVETISWFDKLFEGGLYLPRKPVNAQEVAPLTLLITGPPGTGKTTLALELCYRLARNQGEPDTNTPGAPSPRPNSDQLFTLYISTDQEAQQLIDNAVRYGHEDIKQYLRTFKTRAEPGQPQQLHDLDKVYIWGRDEVQQVTQVDAIFSDAIRGFVNFVTQRTLSARALEKYTRMVLGGGPLPAYAERLHPDIVVIDSLNIVEPQQQGAFFDRFKAAASKGSRLVIFVLDSGGETNTHHLWEYACDIVLRLDHTPVNTVNDYYIRTIEVVKARYQSHVWGKQQLKIYKKSDNLPGEMPHRAHPFRNAGGIFIYPSIHYYLSRYKRVGPTNQPKWANTFPTELSAVLKRGTPPQNTATETAVLPDEGFPEGRCTAFIGCRGGHKSHLGYVHLLHRMIKHNEAALVISLRDDETMTWDTMNRIRMTEFPNQLITLEHLRNLDQLEILYYHPGYITPEEFFHRMFMSLQRLKLRHPGRKLTVLFNSLDQLSSRFPLCAKQEIFIPGIIETLSGEGATSIFIAVDEPGQPAEQYGLLPMADLVLSFYPYRFAFEDYYCHLNEERTLEQSTDLAFTQRVSHLRQKNARSFREETVLQVARFAGGQRAGMRGILELVENVNDSLYTRPGLHFTRLSDRFAQGEYIGGGHRPLYRAWYPVSTDEQDNLSSNLDLSQAVVRGQANK